MAGFHTKSAVLACWGLRQRGIHTQHDMITTYSNTHTEYNLDLFWMVECSPGGPHPLYEHITHTWKSTRASLLEFICRNHGYDGNYLCASEADVVLTNRPITVHLTVKQAEVYSCWQVAKEIGMDISFHAL